MNIMRSSTSRVSSGGCQSTAATIAAAARSSRDFNCRSGFDKGRRTGIRNHIGYVEVDSCTEKLFIVLGMTSGGGSTTVTI